MLQKISMLLLITFFVLVMSLPKSHANIAEPTVQSSISWWNAASYRSLVDSALNPDNNTFKQPQRGATSEIRPDVKLLTDLLIVRARPRFIGTLSRATWGDNQKATDSSAKIQWSEVYTSFEAFDGLTLAYGLQNFQWGPAESVSPSNQIFHETIQVKDILYDTRGHHLMRVNFTPMQELSEVFLIELTGNGESEFTAEESFLKKLALKSEYAWGGGADYAGLILGQKLRGDFWLGEYLNLDIYQGLSFYLDASQQVGSSAWYPTKDPVSDAIVFTQAQKNTNHIYNFAVTGLRYAFENGNDLRFEWIFQEAGYTQDEVSDAWTALTSKNIVQLMHLQQNFPRAQRNGLSFPGQNYLFTSLRIPDAFKFKDWTLYGRLLTSLQDGSMSFHMSSESAMGDAGTIFTTLGLTTGPPQSELRGVVTTAFTLGYRHTW